MNTPSSRPYRTRIQRTYREARPLNNKPLPDNPHREMYRVDEYYLVGWTKLRPSRRKHLMKLQKYIGRSLTGH